MNSRKNNSFFRYLIFAIIISYTFVNLSSAHSTYYSENSNKIDPNLYYIKINEFSSYGVGNKEWIEIVNIGDFHVYFSSLHITDQDGIYINISKYVNYIPKPDAYGNYYILIYMGDGVNDLDYHNNGDDHRVVIYAKLGRDFLDDDGDDILLYHGTYEDPKCQYIDYIAYYNGGPKQDIDKTPIGSNLVFTLNGSGYYGYIPAPGNDESVSLVPSGKDTNSSYNWYITRDIVSGQRYVRARTPGKKNVNILQVCVEDIAPVNQTQGDEKSILKLELKSVGDSPMYINSLFFGVNGTILDREILAGIYSDRNGNGVWDTGDQAMITSYATFSGGMATIGTPNIQIAQGIKAVYFVTILLSSEANISHYFSLFLIDIDMGRLPDGHHTDEIFMKINQPSKYVRVSPRDQTPPKIYKLLFDKKEPLGIGSHNISIIFNEVMDISTQANVTYGLFGYEYRINGKWVNSTCWKGTLKIDENGPSGKLIIKIEARDFYWNRIVEIRYFYVDITKPYVKTVKYSKLPPYPYGIDVNITIEFSENVTDTNFTLKADRVVFYPSVNKINNSTYTVKFVTSELSENEYYLEISGARDSANNVMDKYIIENLTMDFQPPLVSIIEVKEWPAEDETVIMKVFCEDNLGIKSVWAVYNYEGRTIEILGSYEEDHWKIILVRSSVRAPELNVIIFVEDIAGNTASFEKRIDIVPWWKVIWWVWVLIAISLSIISYLLYDHYKTTRIQRKMKKIIIESEVPAESIIIKIGKSFSRLTKRTETSKKKEKKGKEVTEETSESATSESHIESVVEPEFNISEIPEVPFAAEEDELPDLTQKKTKKKR